MSLTNSSLQNFLDQFSTVALVRVEMTQGSVPREAGTWMLVSPDECFGTIGGGQLEYMAIDEARALFKNGGNNRTLQIPLGPDIGQCCGGNVKVLVEILDSDGRQVVVKEQQIQISSHPFCLCFWRRTRWQGSD